jgi:hypothetical protein
MNNPHLALIFIRRFSDFFREPLDQLSIFFRGQRGQFGFRKGCAREPLYDWMAQAGSHARRSRLGAPDRAQSRGDAGIDHRKASRGRQNAVLLSPRRVLFLVGDQLAGSVPRHQAGWAMDGDRFDQLAGAVIDVGANRAHVAQFAAK